MHNKKLLMLNIYINSLLYKYILTYYFIKIKFYFNLQNNKYLSKKIKNFIIKFFIIFFIGY